MSKIIVRNSSSEDKGYFCACIIDFPNGNSTKLVAWEFEAVKQSGRLFILVMLLYYDSHYKQSGITDYHRLVRAINRL